MFRGEIFIPSKMKNINWNLFELNFELTLYSLTKINWENNFTAIFLRNLRCPRTQMDGKCFDVNANKAIPIIAQGE